MLIKDIKKSKKFKPDVKKLLIENRRRELSRLKERRKKGLCTAELGHGPGHQSHTFCERKGKHTIHSCTYGCYDQYMEWRGKKIKYTGYFDEPKAL